MKKRNKTVILSWEGKTVIFTKHNLTLQLLDVLKIKNTHIKKYNQSRHFSALSLRKRSDAVIRCGGRTLTMVPGSVGYFPPDLDYTRTAEHDEMIVIHFQVYNYSSSRIEVYRAVDFEGLQRLFDEIYRVWSSNGRDRYYEATALLYRIFGFMTRDCPVPEGAERHTVREAKQIMEAEYGDPCLSIRRIAERLQISQEYLRRVFRDNENRSPKQYLQDLRLRRASSLLTGGYYSVRQVAEKCGFTDEKYFSTAFKKQIGVPPSKYEYRFNER